MSEILFSPGRRVHFVGIAGSGMSGIASILLGRGVVVTGSDNQEQSSLEPLRSSGARIFIGHDAKNIEGAQILVTSSAIPRNNPEVAAAEKDGLPILGRAEALAELLVGRRSIAVAGTHGKTTTSGMLAWTLAAMGEDPSFVIGSKIQGLNSGSGDGSGDVFVVEADESDGSFMRYRPLGAVITNLELDHVDNFKNLEEVRRAFQEFVKTVRTFLILCGNDAELAKLEIPSTLRTVTYGIAEAGKESFDLQLSNLLLSPRSSSASISWRGRPLGTLTLSISGRHNLLNAGAVIATLLELGFERQRILTALASFQGTSRRFEFKGEIAGIRVIDDYGHHPTEIQATLAMARSYMANVGRLVVIFQPHRFSRTAVFHREFATALTEADLIFLTDIYAASEAPIEGVTAGLIASEIPQEKVYYLSNREELISQLISKMEPGDLVLTLGAGDVTHLAGEILERLHERNS
ncbi:MAG: UDP-N-acetylmuramate--L-alanine ligase [Candidatus Nanopelagicaceae bacterium]